MKCCALGGRRLLAVDGSVVCEPGETNAVWRLHYTMDIDTLSCQEMQITSTRVGESLTRFAVRQGDVIIADRCFANRRGVNHILDHGGDVLVRMNLCSLPLQDEHGALLFSYRIYSPCKPDKWENGPLRCKEPRGRDRSRVRL